jgi:hypothetical protein
MERTKALSLADDGDDDDDDDDDDEDTTMTFRVKRLAAVDKTFIFAVLNIR